MTILDDVTEAIFQGLSRGDDTRTIAFYALKAGLPRPEWRKDTYGHDRRALYLCGLFVGCILPIKAGGPFRAWLMTDDEGDRIGKDEWPSENAAREALYSAALERIAAPKLSLESGYVVLDAEPGSHREAYATGVGFIKSEKL